MPLSTHQVIRAKILGRLATMWPAAVPLTLGLAMLIGRFLMIVPALAIAGSMIGKKTVPAGPGTFPTNGPTFTLLLISVVLIVGALTFFPALSLGPVLEHFAALAGKVF